MKENNIKTISTLKRRSISRRLIWYVILFSSTITLLTSSIQIYIEYNRELKEIDNSFMDIESSLLPNIVKSQWTLDYDFLITQLNGISKLPNMQYLELKSKNYPPVIIGKLQPKNTIKRTFKLIHLRDNKTLDLGTLDVYASLDGINEKILNMAFVILATQTIIISLVSSFIVVAFYLLIGRHLIYMSNYVRSLAYDDLGNPLVLNRGSEERYLDELGQLEIGINEMRENLASDKYVHENIENQLRESENRLRTLLENIPQKIFYKDTQSVYITCNNNYAKDLKTTEKDIAGKTDFDFHPPELAKKYRDDDKAIISEGVSKEFEERYFIDDKEIIVQTIKTPIFNAEGEKIGLMGIFWDITQRKKDELELQKTKNELEIRVKERTARLEETNRKLEEQISIHKQTEEKLIFAKQDAERANLAKSEFLSNISHELRTPMHHILNYSRFGLEKVEEVPLDKLIHYFSQIRKTGSRLMILLNDLLDLSKLESGRAEYKFKQHNVVQILEDAISEIKILAREKDVKILTEAGQNQITANCDAYKIGQVFRNLLSNAIKYSPINQTVSVSIILRDSVKKDQNLSYLRISVSDSGIGIPINEFDSIFDKFTQSSNTKTGAGGSGLGLAICKEIVEGHQGRIWVKNNSTGGTTFYFTLPLESKTAIE